MQLRLMLDESLTTVQPYLFGEFRILDVRESGSLRALQQWLGSERYVALDFETLSPPDADINTPRHFEQAEVVILALSHRSGTVVLHCTPDRDPRTTDAYWRDYLQLLQDRYVVVYNGAYDIPLFHRITGRMPAGIIDAMMLYGLVTPGRTVQAVLRSQSLATAVQVLFETPIDKSVRETFHLDRFTGITAQQCRYAAEDARWTLLLAVKLAQLCVQSELTRIAELEMRLTPVLIRMQLLGVQVDMDVVSEYERQVDRIASDLERDILRTLSHDKLTVVGFTGQGDPVTMAEAAASVQNGGVGIQFHALDRPVSTLPTHRHLYREVADRYAQYPLRSAREVLNPRSTYWLHGYLWLLSGGRIVTTESVQLSTYSSGLASGILASPYPPPFVEHIPRLLDTIVDYRAVLKVRNTYLRSWQSLQHHGRVHTTYVQTYAESGRISSRHPNLQNCPRPDTTRFLSKYMDDEGMDMRGMFVAPPGRVLITADYSQYELRVAAERAEEHQMIDIYLQEYRIRERVERLLRERHGLYPWQESEVQEAAQSDDELAELLTELKSVDFHRINAARIFGKNPDEVTKQERSEAKSISFGVLYGMQEKSLAETIRRLTGREIRVEEAEALLKAYFATYRNLWSYIQRTIHHARHQGYVMSIMGRRRWCLFPRNESDRGLRRFLNRVTAGVEREAVNHTIQATNADATKWALVLLDERLQERGWLDRAYPVLTVHDEIVVECERSIQHEVALLLRDCMVEGSRRAGLVRVPTVVEVAIGPSWKK